MRMHPDNFADVTLGPDYCTVDIKRLSEWSSASQCPKSGREVQRGKFGDEHSQATLDVRLLSKKKEKKKEEYCVAWV